MRKTDNRTMQQRLDSGQSNLRNADDDMTIDLTIDLTKQMVQTSEGDLYPITTNEVGQQSVLLPDGDNVFLRITFRSVN
jgi:hypothetical protein